MTHGKSASVIALVSGKPSAFMHDHILTPSNNQPGTTPNQPGINTDHVNVPETSTGSNPVFLALRRCSRLTANRSTGGITGNPATTAKVAASKAIWGLDQKANATTTPPTTEPTDIMVNVSAAMLTNAVGGSNEYFSSNAKRIAGTQALPGTYFPS